MVNNESISSNTFAFRAISPLNINIAYLKIQECRKTSDTEISLDAALLKCTKLKEQEQQT